MLRLQDNPILNTKCRNLLLSATLVFLGLLTTALGNPIDEIPSNTSEKAINEPFETRYLDEDENMLIAIHMNRLIQDSGLATHPLIKNANSFQDIVNLLGLKCPKEWHWADIEQIVTPAQMTSQGTGKPNSRSLAIGTKCIYLRMMKEVAVKPFFDLNENQFKSYLKDGIEFYSFHLKLGTISQNVYLYSPDEHSILFLEFEREDEFLSYLKKARERKSSQLRESWKAVERSTAAIYFNNTKDYYSRTFEKDLDNQKGSLAVLKNVQCLAVGIEANPQMTLRVFAECKDDRTVQAIHQQCVYLQDLVRDKLKAKKPDEDTLFSELMLELLVNRKSTAKENQLEIKSSSKHKIQDCLGAEK